MRTVLICSLICVLAPTAAEAEDEMLDEEIVEEAVEADTTGQGGAEVVEAEEIEIASFHDYPVRFALRPLVLNTGMVRGDSRLTVGGVFGSGTFSSLDLGGAVSPIDGLEVGLSTELTGAVPAPGGIDLITIIFSPNASYGDIPVYARYQFYEGERGFLAGADLTLVIPSNTDFSLIAGIPMRVLELFGIFTIDMNVNFRYRNGDKYAAFTQTTPSKNTVDLTFSGAANVNLTDQGFVQIGGGVGVVNINGASDAKNVVELPFFLGGGYTLQRKILTDFIAQFGWMPLMTANGPPGVDTFNVGDTWFITIGATIYTKPLFGKNKGG